MSRQAKFTGSLGFLSNFASVPHGIHGYKTVEHFYQAMKTTDPQLRQAIKDSSTANDSKLIGRRVELREGWSDLKLEVMLYALQKKFEPGSVLAERLKAIPDSDLIELNDWHDNFWGDCVCSKCAANPGHNHLGRMLKQVKHELF